MVAVGDAIASITPLDPKYGPRRASKRKMIDSFLICRTQNTNVWLMPAHFHMVLPHKDCSINASQRKALTLSGVLMFQRTSASGHHNPPSFSM